MMLRHMMKSKIEKVFITDVNLEYRGSIGIDAEWIEKANLLVGEKVHVLNLNNGERFETYVVEAPRGSKDIKLFGPAARLGMKGDRLTIISYMLIDDIEAKNYNPKIVAQQES